MSTDKPDPKLGDGREGFLTRWSRLKRTGEASQTAGILPPDDGAAADTAAVAEPSLDLSKLPKIDDLTAGSDFKAFLQAGVPADLQRAALRKAWSLDPAIRDFVEVAENQYDWNVPDGVPGFGPLAPGTDIAALLKQAIGGVSDNDETQSAGAQNGLSDPHDRGSQAMPAQDAHMRGSLTACDESRGQAAVADSIRHEPAPRSATAREPEHAVTALHNAPVRRHGSALPKLSAQRSDPAK